MEKLLNLKEEVQKDIITRSSLLSHSSFVCFVSLLGVFWSIVSLSPVSNLFWISLGVITALILLLFYISVWYYKQELTLIEKRKVSLADFFRKKRWYFSVNLLVLIIHLIGIICFVLLL